MDFLTLTAKIKTPETRSGAKAPEWITLFKAGWIDLADGVTFLADPEAFNLITAHIRERGNEVVFDYEHQTLENMEAPAAGWIKELVWEDGVGIRARVAWTERGAAYIQAGEYRYFSPVFVIRKKDKRVCALHSVALTNTPKTNHLTPILAKLGSKTRTKEKDMNREKLIKALGLDAGATDQEIMAAIAKLEIRVPEEKTVEKEVLPRDIIAALKLKDNDTASTVVASIHALQQSSKNSVSRAEFDKLAEDLARRDAGDAVQAAIAGGKVTPDQKEWAMDYAMKDLDGFNTFVAKAPRVIPVDKLPGHEKNGDGQEMTESILNVAAMMGVEEADLKKYGEVQHG